MEKPKHYITIRVKESASIAELDFLLDDQLFTKEEFDDNHSRQSIFFGQETVEGYPILLDLLITWLHQFKERGCNYVQLQHHPDHIGYDIDGLHIARSTSEEIAAYESNLEKLLNKEDKIQALKNEIRRIEDSKD